MIILHKLPSGFFEWRWNKSFTGSFLGILLEVDGWTSVGRSGRESLESLNDLKSKENLFSVLKGKYLDIVIHYLS